MFKKKIFFIILLLSIKNNENLAYNTHYLDMVDKYFEKNPVEKLNKLESLKLILHVFAETDLDQVEATFEKILRKNENEQITDFEDTFIFLKDHTEKFLEEEYPKEFLTRLELEDIVKENRLIGYLEKTMKIEEDEAFNFEGGDEDDENEMLDDLEDKLRSLGEEELAAFGEDYNEFHDL